MRILFVSRSNLKKEVPPIIKNQGKSLINSGVDIDYHVIQKGGFLSYLKNIFQIKEIIKKESFDIVHVHYGISGLAVLMAHPKIPVIISLMGSEILGINTKKGTVSKKGKLIRSIVKASLSRYDAIVVKSMNMQREIPQFDTNIIPNGVSFEKFKPIKKSEARNLLGLNSEDIVILFPANKARIEKNFDLFSKSVDRLGFDNLKILWFDHIPNSMTVNYYNASDVVVLTSMHEGSPNVIKEAMACNVPIVSTDVGDVKEVISNTAGCFIAKSNASDISKKYRWH